MPVLWSDKNVLERLIIAFLASVDNKVGVLVYFHEFPHITSSFLSYTY